nr:transposase [Paratractidigestivibacter sp.]
MDVEADQLRGSSGNSRNGYRGRGLKTCVGELALRVPKLRGGQLLPRGRHRALPEGRPGAGRRGGRDARRRRRTWRRRAGPSSRAWGLRTG